MFSLLKLALHRHPLDEPLRDIKWTNYEPSLPPGLVLRVESGSMRITDGNEDLFHHQLSGPNQTVLKGAFGELNVLD